MHARGCSGLWLAVSMVSLVSLACACDLNQFDDLVRAGDGGGIVGDAALGDAAVDSGSMCLSVEQLCNNGLDDDCDGTADCADLDDCTDQSCDDGFFCNGVEVCAAGECAHRSLPCTDLCTESTRSCAACMGAADCGEASYTEWMECAYGSTCDDSGEQTRYATTPTCESGLCTFTVTTERMACPRDTDGVSCGTSQAEEWPTDCSFADPCTETGTQFRNVTNYACNAGTCEVSMDEESRACSRASQTGVQCGASTRFRCCDEACKDTWADNAHCGGCGLSCTSGLTCQIIPAGTGADCHGCSADAQCPPDNATTCYSVAFGGNDFCQCTNDTACASGQLCMQANQENYCYYP